MPCKADKNWWREFRPVAIDVSRIVKWSREEEEEEKEKEVR